MEPGPYLEIINFAGPQIYKYWNYHRKLEELLDILRSIKEDLNVRYEDTRLRLNNELCHLGKQPKQEVENWLKKVDKIIGEIQSLEDEVGEVKYFSRAFLGKRVYKKIEETTEVYGEGSFSESLVIDDPSNSGMALSTPELVSEVAVKEKIWQYLMGDSLCKIGVCGMGGIGKTTIMKHIHNELLREAKFDKVIWVTVSQECDVFKLQEKIASALGEDLSKHEDEAIRVTVLSKILESRKRHVLILDDVWKKYRLQEVGIPEPSISNGCKLVLTTRSIELALYMGCETIRVAPLSEGDALNLFLNHAGRDVYVPTLKPTLKEVVEQCAGLPLAIIIIGSSMRGEYDVHVWKNALNKLKKQVGSVESTADDVFKRLKFSYDHLPSEKLKHCFLCCALYPEDFAISKEELIEYWIVEGLLDEMDTRQEMYDEGFSILKRLENNCLLESVKDLWSVECVKIHDVVRDLALHITSTESPRYLVKAGMQLEELPNEQEWKEDVQKVSLMQNRIREISLIPKCRTLSTLFLQNNRSLKRIHKSFFTHMTGLTVLNLSGNLTIKALPNSVSELQNLNALLLHNCGNLEYVPSLSKIRGLKKLDLGVTHIKEVPHGMEMLVHLRYLDLNSSSIMVPAGILPKLSRLQHLRLDRTPNVIVEEVAGLKKLETLGIQFNNLEGYRLYLSRLQPGCLNRYYFHVGIAFRHTYEKFVGFRDLSFGGDSILLPTDIQELTFINCHDITSLSDHNSSFKYATDLRYLVIGLCKGIECLVSSSFCYNILQSIEKLELRYLDNFSVLVRGERDRSAASTLPTPTPPGMFSRLKYIEIRKCPKIEKLFWPELVQNLQNLEQIQVVDCEQLVEIISTSDDDEENKEEGKDFTVFTLPKLKEMTFQNVPQLKYICNHRSRMECNSLENIKIADCPKLKRIPPLLPQPDNGQLLPPVSLRQITIKSKEWWDSLEWDHPNIKNVLEPSLCVDRTIGWNDYW
ncbi:hypothetical protein LWI29_020166 [Acer saccharum]|uniref:NB-ARC domain-containing protein n=1 Tax=Acer saccharum TaxID=4024 RepID=A0AA39RWS1_ACESA|nr:hypothetical protein LWI29_020166 [Acer saccharum]